MSERQEGSSLFGEIRRMARTSGAVGGIAARVAGQRFTEATRPDARALHAALDTLDAKVRKGADDGVTAARNWHTACGQVPNLARGGLIGFRP